jgi:hypothetical protein
MSLVVSTKQQDKNLGYVLQLLMRMFVYVRYYLLSNKMDYLKVENMVQTTSALVPANHHIPAYFCDGLIDFFHYKLNLLNWQTQEYNQTLIAYSTLEERIPI